MYKDTFVMAKNVKNSRLLALFSTLEERDKDIVISMSESLVERCRNDLTKMIPDFPANKMKDHLVNRITSVR